MDIDWDNSSICASIMAKLRRHQTSNAVVTLADLSRTYNTGWDANQALFVFVADQPEETSRRFAARHPGQPRYNNIFVQMDWCAVLRYSRR